MSKHLHYHLDSENYIISLSSGWVEFALENAGINLSPDAILGRSIWDFITEGQIRHLYKVLFEKVKTQNKVLVIDFRCDSPNLRRYMKLSISPLQASQLLLESWLVREEKRDPIRLLNPGTSALSTFLRMCSWCKRVELDKGSWVEVEVAVEKMELFYTDSLPQVTHGICTECEERILKQLEKEP